MPDHRRAGTYSWPRFCPAVGPAQAAVDATLIAGSTKNKDKNDPEMHSTRATWHFGMKAHIGWLNRTSVGRAPADGFGDAYHRCTVRSHRTARQTSLDKENNPLTR